MVDSSAHSKSLINILGSITSSFMPNGPTCGDLGCRMWKVDALVDS